MLQNIKNSKTNTLTETGTARLFYIETYGCQMNVYDSELVENQLKKSGYKATNNIESADLIFLNTCAIREKAEETVQAEMNLDLQVGTPLQNKQGLAFTSVLETKKLNFEFNLDEKDAEDKVLKARVGYMLEFQKNNIYRFQRTIFST